MIMEVRKGAWWLNSCMQFHVNGPYHPNGGPIKKWSGVLWRFIEHTIYKPSYEIDINNYTKSK